MIRQTQLRQPTPKRSMANRIKQAKLPWEWSIESFPFEQQPKVSPSQIRSLASLDFIQQTENIVLIGPPGAGKSGLATGLLRRGVAEWTHRAYRLAL
ncbi:MAG: ATP-binding protein [Gammaproteobacteria bacterium]|nr:ATP-binding protein [Gammaproteobacteria bacterium]MBT7326998.1 ATP-binding protein [Gammaproteobacteria bacterium]